VVLIHVPHVPWTIDSKRVGTPPKFVHQPPVPRQSFRRQTRRPYLTNQVVVSLDRCNELAIRFPAQLRNCPRDQQGFHPQIICQRPYRRHLARRNCAQEPRGNPFRLRQRNRSRENFITDQRSHDLLVYETFVYFGAFAVSQASTFLTLPSPIFGAPFCSILTKCPISSGAAG
jgi:hypothetical protein